jgi:hypothetical protein
MSSNESFMPKNVGEMQDRLQEMYAGLTSSSGSFTNLVLNGKSYTNATLAPVVLAYLSLFTAVTQAHTAYEQALSSRDAAWDTILAFMESFVKGIESQVSSSDQALAPYGFRTRKTPAPQTVKEKAAKVDKSLATREKNNTLGKDQKKALDQGDKSNVTQPNSGQKS